VSPFLGAQSDEDHRNSGDETAAGAVSRRKGAERDMEAMVDMTCVGQEQIAQWLHLWQARVMRLYKQRLNI